jgi:putative membrane protein
MLSMMLAACTAVAIPAVAVTAGADARRDSNTQLNAADRQFLGDAYSISRLEAELGKHAQDHGATDQTKDVGRGMACAYSVLGDQLGRAASKESVALPNQMGVAQKNVHDRLTALRGQDFDSAYLEHLVSGQEQAVETFEREEKTGQNANLRAFAAKELPVLQACLVIAKQEQANPEK